MTLKVGDTVAFMHGLMNWTVDTVSTPSPHSPTQYLTLVRPSNQVRHSVRSDRVFVSLATDSTFHKGDTVAFQSGGTAHVVIKVYDTLELEVRSVHGAVRFVSKNSLHNLRLLRRAE